MFLFFTRFPGRTRLRIKHGTQCTTKQCCHQWTCLPSFPTLDLWNSWHPVRPDRCGLWHSTDRILGPQRHYIGFALEACTPCSIHCFPHLGCPVLFPSLLGSSTAGGREAYPIHYFPREAEGAECPHRHPFVPYSTTKLLSQSIPTHAFFHQNCPH
jgi:hypothetical protein